MLINILFVWMFRLCLSWRMCVHLFDVFVGRFVFLLSHSAQICVYCHIHAAVSLMDEMRWNIYETLITVLKCPCGSVNRRNLPPVGGQTNGQAAVLSSCVLSWAVSLYAWRVKVYLVVVVVLFCFNFVILYCGLCCFALILLFYIEFCVVLLWLCCFILCFMLFCFI